MKKFYSFSIALVLGATAAGAYDVGAVKQMLLNSLPQMPEPAEVKVDVPEVTLDAAATAKLQAVAKSDAVAHNWKSIGQCQFTDDISTAFFTYDPQTYMVEVCEDVDNPGYYCIVEPFGSAHPYYTSLRSYLVDDATPRYLVIDATDPDNVIVEKSATRFVISDLGTEEWSVMSYSYLEKVGMVSAGFVSRYGLAGTMENNIITFPASQSMFIATESSYAQAKGYTANNNGKFELRLPGAVDYSLDVMAGSWCGSDDDKAIFTAWGGTDIASIVGGAVTDLNDEAQLTDILTNGTAMTSGQGSYINLPTGLAPNQYIYLVAVGLDAQGAVKAASATIVYAPDRSTDWVTLDGKASFTDYMVSHAYDLAVKAVDVEVQESTTKPGYFRLVNPYRYTTANTLTSSVHGKHDHYLYLDASDPDCVVLEEGPVGFITSTDGDVRLSSRASRLIQGGVTKDEVKAQGYGGVMTDNVITFPFKAYIYAGFLVEGPDYWMNVNFTQDAAGNYGDGRTKIDLSKVKASVESPVVDANDAPVEYFNLQGVRMQGDLTPGLYIRRQGTQTSKVVVR